MLRGAASILNGKPLEDWACEVIRWNDDQMELRYIAVTLDDGAFGFKAAHPDARS